MLDLCDLAFDLLEEDFGVMLSLESRVSCCGQELSWN